MIKTLNRLPSIGAPYISLNEVDSEKMMEEVLITPYEKVMKILRNIKSHLIFSKTEEKMINDLDWVVQRIETHNLYTYENSGNSDGIKKLSKNSNDFNIFFGFLDNYSEKNELRTRRRHKTTLVKERIFPKINNDLILEGNPQDKLEKVKNELCKLEPNLKKIQILNINILSTKTNNYNEVKLNKREELDDLNIYQGDCSILKDKEFFEKKNYICNESINKSDFFLSKLAINQDELVKIYEYDFDIFNFNKIIGRSKSMIIGAKLLFKYMEINKMISVPRLDEFLMNVRDCYNDIFYHNELHGLDVCQTACIFISKTNIVESIELSDYDVLSLVISSLTHDIGHPGNNNNFQINNCTEIAITYNDKSVLENFHASETFKILRKPQCNIFENTVDINDLRQIRKSVIESILSTDMMNHAKIHSIIKNKIEMKHMKNGQNISKLVSKDSSSFLTEKQDILNFLIHAADISHNSKDYNISYKWTYLLSQEFWQQGDLEKSLNLPVSFLCDRNTADVPNSQIRFITTIIIPTFDSLINILPQLKYYLDNVYKNVDHWRNKVNNKTILEDEKLNHINNKSSSSKSVSSNDASDDLRF